MEHTRFKFSFYVAPELNRSGNHIYASQLDSIIAHDKKHAACKVGQLIADHVGFNEEEDPDSLNNKRYVLDVVAFRTAAYWKFKKELRDILVNGLLPDKELDRVKSLFDNLENSDESIKDSKEVNK